LPFRGCDGRLPVTDASTHPGLLGFLDELEWSGILHATTPGLRARLETDRPIAGYNGFDPTADSLHVGHLIPIFGMVRFQRHGGKPIALVGGGTGMIGDPSGRSSERNLLDLETLAHNVAAIRGQLEHFLDFSPGPAQAEMANNLDWLGKLSLIDYLRDTGKHFTIPYMLAKDSVQQRLDRGLSFTEFSYMTLQALDFATLYREQGVELQMGGADQWGNITAGLELIRRTSGEAEESPAHGIAYKLLLSPSGAKFGKSEGGESVWLDPARTSPYAFYQHWLNADDRDIGTYLRWFTLFEREEIEALDAAVASRPEQREAQRRLAFDVTSRVHGEEAAREAERQGRAAFSQDLAALSLEDLVAMRDQVPHVVVGPEALGDALGVAIAAGAYPSKGEARRQMANGGFYVNNERIIDPAAPLPPPLHGRFWVVRTGKRNVRLVEPRE
jgi:tyrosyl-tRNA synthetase